MVDGVAFYHLILGRKKAGDLFSDFLLGVPLYGRRVFSCKSSGRVEPMCGKYQTESYQFLSYLQLISKTTGSNSTKCLSGVVPLGFSMPVTS
mgnify:CR=1 FL=1